MLSYHNCCHTTTVVIPQCCHTTIVVIPQCYKSKCALNNVVGITDMSEGIRDLEGDQRIFPHAIDVASKNKMIDLNVFSSLCTLPYLLLQQWYIPLIRV